MDFHSLTRRELQALCKKNKIPANLTNVSMADSLKSLQIVEGIEEVLNPSESVTAQSTIESPEKSEVTSSPCVPRTGGRTTRRTAVRNQVVENSQVSTRVRRSTRKLVVGEVDDEKLNKGIKTPAAANTRRTQGVSVRRKMDSQLKEVEEDKKIEKEDSSETPKVVPGSQQRGPSMVKLVYSTRRSTRLAEKNKDDTHSKKNEKLESFKGDLFAEESGENLEISGVKEGECSNDLGEIIESTDIDLKEKLDDGLERNNDKEDNSDENSDSVIEKEVQLEESSESSEVVKSEMNIEEDAVEGHQCEVDDKAADDLKTEVHTEVCEETDPSAAEIVDKPLEMADEIKENSGGADLYLTKKEDVVKNMGDKVNANEVVVSQNIAEIVEEEVISQDDAFTTDNKTLKMSEEITNFFQDGDSGSYDDLSLTDKVLENSDHENDMEFKVGSLNKVLEVGHNENDLGEANKYSGDLAASDNNDKVSGKSCAVESPLTHPKAEEQQDTDLVNVFDFTSELGNIFSTSAETELIHTVLPTCLTPSKKSASKKTPTTIKKLSHVFDDKENIDNSGTKLIPTKEKKKIEGFGQAQYVDLSLRQLKKVVKEKTEMSKKKDDQVMCSRPALQAVSENIVTE